MFKKGGELCDGTKLFETHHVLKVRDVYNSACIISTLQPVYISSPNNGSCLGMSTFVDRGGYTKPEGNANVLFAKCGICPLQFCFSSTSSCKEGHDLCQGHLVWERRPLSPRAHGARCRVGARSTPPRVSQPAVSRRVVFRPRLACVPCWRPPRACFLEGTAPS